MSIDNPDKAPEKGPAKKKKKRRFNIYRMLVVTIVTAFLAATAYVVATAFIRENPTFTPQKHLIKIHRSMQDPGAVAFGDKDRVLILCLGLDENRDWKGIGHTKGSRTDTIFILNLDKKAQRLGILSIPRDIYIYRGETLGYGKVNAIYAEAFWSEYEKSGYDYEKAKMAGLMAARKALQDFLGIEIDYYCLLKIKATTQLVDALGGLTVDVEKDMDYDDNWGKLHIHLKKGRQRLNGAQAVGYARFRHDAEGDWGRIRRQQQVIKALVGELKKPVHIMHINKLAKIVKENLDTNLELGEIIDIAHVYKNFDPKNITKGVVTGYDDYAGGGAVIVPHEHEVKRLVRRVLRSPSDILPEEIRLRVINREADLEKFDRVVKKLREDGYNIVQVTTIVKPLAPIESPSPTPEPSPSPEISPYESPTETLSPGESPSPSPSETYSPMDPTAPVKEPEYKGTELIDHFGNDKGAKMILNRIKYYKARVTKKHDDYRDAPSDFTLIIGPDYYEMPDDPRMTVYPSPRFEIDDNTSGTFKSRSTEAPVDVPASR